MSPASNRQVRLKSRPNGIPQAEHFEIVDSAVPEIADGQFLVRNDYLSVEPAMRGWVSAVANYSKPVGIGDVMRAFTAGTVVKSHHAGYAEGDAVMGLFGWQDYAVSDGGNVTRKIKETDLPLSLSLGILGLNGVTAYFGLLDVGRAAAGRYGGRFHRSRRRRFGGRPDRQARGLPHRRSDRRRRQGENLRAGLRLRCGDRLQGRQARRGFGGRLPARHRRVFRQHRGRHQRCRAGTARHRRPRDNLRHGLDRELGSAAAGAAGRAASVW